MMIANFNNEFNRHHHTNNNNNYNNNYRHNNINSNKDFMQPNIDNSNYDINNRKQQQQQQQQLEIEKSETNNPYNLYEHKQQQITKFQKQSNQVKLSSSYHTSLSSSSSSSSNQFRTDYIHFKLIDLINPNRNKTFIDNLYAKFQPNSNKIDLLYIPPMDIIPENSILLSNQTFNNLNNTNTTNYNKDLIDANKVLNEFYLTAAKHTRITNSNIDNTGPHLPRMQPSEIFLILFVISLWLISIFICLRRYSLFLCFHKRDVPFYNASLINVSAKIGNDNASNITNINNNPNNVSITNASICKKLSTSRSNSPVNRTSCMCNSSNDILLNTELNSSNILLYNQPSNEDSNRNSSMNNQYTDPSSSVNISKKAQSVIYCNRCNCNTRSKDLHYKSISNGNFDSTRINQTYLLQNKSSTRSSNLNRANEISLLSNLKAKYYNKYNMSTQLYNNDYYFSNGIIYPNSRNSSVLMMKANNNINHSKGKLSNKSLINANRSRVAMTSTPTSTIMPLNSDQDVFDENLLATKRSVIRNKHFNLMSLDENALNLYRENHKLNFCQQQEKKKKNLKIPPNCLNVSPTSTNATTPSGANVKATTPLSYTSKMDAQAARLTLATPHANFISLRSGSESANSSWVKPGRSYDYDNSESNEIFSLVSLQQSQSLLQPPFSTNNIQNQPASNQSSNQNLTNNNNSFKNSIVSNPVPSYTTNPTSMHQRPINPISSLRRHMFVNSRRNAHTTVDYANLSRNYEDSINNEQSYEMVNSVSIASNNQLASMILASSNANYMQPAIETTEIVETIDTQTLGLPINSPPSQSVSNHTNIETINECADPNLLNPSWIPLIVRRTLLEMHERVVFSKSDSNIKAKYRSSNHLLHSPTAKTNQEKISKSKNRKKKPLSLQNSQDKTAYFSVNNNSRTSGNYLNNFYDELRSKIFQNGLIGHNKSTSTSNTMSTNVSNALNKQDSISGPNSNVEQATPNTTIINNTANSSGQNINNLSSFSNTTVIINENPTETAENENENLIVLTPAITLNSELKAL